MTDPVTIEELLDRLRSGDLSARSELLNLTMGRLRRLAERMLRDGFGRLRRWEDADDVLQNAAVRLHRSLSGRAPATPLDFFRLAALSIRRELYDLARHYYGPQGRATLHDGSPDLSLATSAPGPARLAEWTEFHERMATLPEPERAVADLIWYQGLSQEATAALLRVDVRTVQRRWYKARASLSRTLRAG